MKHSLITILTILAILPSANAAAKKGREVTVKGALAKQLITLAEKYGNADAAMGHYFGNTEAVVCIKHVGVNDSSNDQVKCAVSYQGQTKTVTTKNANHEEFESALDLRAALIEATGAEKKISAEEKRIKVKSIDCSGTASAHTLDDLDIEAGVTCKIRI